MNAVLKESKATRAKCAAPKGQSAVARVATNSKKRAIAVMPEKAMRVLPASSPSKRGKAKHLLPEKAGLVVPSPAPIAVAAKDDVPKGHTPDAAQQPNASESATTFVPKGQKIAADHSHTIATLRELHRKRQDFHRSEKSLTLQIKAICRRLCAGDKDEADKLYAAMLKGAEDAQAMMAREWTEPFIQARAILEMNRKQVEKDMERVAKTLPVAKWVEGIKGFGIGSLAAVIGEAGDLSNYPTHSHLWKRLGLAVIDGGRQRMVPGADALAHGYSPSRRSVVWNIGQCVFKAQSPRVDKETGEVKVEAGEYRKLYDARKEYEMGRVETKGHAHNRAMRYMEKKLMRDLWKAWRVCG
jgi:hypothetical protein